MIIPDTELMAEKLGMVVLCAHCGGRLKSISVLRIPLFIHISNESVWCSDKGGFRASARNGPLADQLYAIN